MKITNSVIGSAVSICCFAPVAMSAPAPKVNVCHATGDGTFHLINISSNALDAHLAHGDVVQPAAGTTSAVITVGGVDVTLDTNCVATAVVVATP